MAVLFIKISCAITRPFLVTPSSKTFGNKVCDNTATKLEASCILICVCCPSGNTSTIRSTVEAAFEVCKVPKTKCPVSAAVNAREIVSKSRISPKRIMSGSSRKADFKALAKLLVSCPSSLWCTTPFLEV